MGEEKRYRVRLMHGVFYEAVVQAESAQQARELAEDLPDAAWTEVPEDYYEDIIDVELAEDDEDDEDDDDGEQNGYDPVGGGGGHGRSDLPYGQGGGGD